MNQTLFNIIAGVFGVIVSYAFGAWSGLLEIFFLAMAFDYITGCAASLKEGKGLKSGIGFWGLVKKVLMAAAVMFGHRADLAFETDYIMIGFLSAFLANEIVSLGENYGRLGLPFSQYLEPVIAILKKGGVKS